MVDLERRIEQLERVQRRWRRGACCLGGLLLAGLLLGARADSNDEEIRTGRLVLTDDKGRARAALTVNSDGTALIGLMDGSRHTRASLFVAEDGTAGLSLADPGQTPRVKLELNAAGDRPLVAVLDADERARGELALAEDGAPSLRLSDAAGEALAVLPEPDSKTANPASAAP